MLIYLAFLTGGRGGITVDAVCSLSLLLLNAMFVLMYDLLYGILNIMSTE